MKRLNVKSRVVLGMVGLTVSLVMLAVNLGIVPDRASAVREGRTSLAETIAVHSTGLIMRGQFQRLAADFVDFDGDDKPRFAIYDYGPGDNVIIKRPLVLTP